jgi:hypothetical protein
MKHILFGVLVSLIAGCTNYGYRHTYQPDPWSGAEKTAEVPAGMMPPEVWASDEAPFEEPKDVVTSFDKAAVDMEAIDTAAFDVAGADALDMALLAPNAQPGECYARVYVPPVYKTVTEQVVVQEASEAVEIIQAEYEWVEEHVMIEPATERMETIPAQYKWVEEKVLVKPAQSVWKRGNGLLEKVDGATGEIMCLVEVPAEYKMVRKQVMTKPADVRRIAVPARYETVRKKRLVSPARHQTNPVEARYETVTKQVKESDGRVEWRKVLCETNFTRDRVMRIQQALVDAGYDPGPVDGVVGPRTLSAIKTYQKNNGLAIGGLTYETLVKLGVDVPQ